MSQEPSHAETVFSRERRYTEEDFMMRLEYGMDEEQKARLAARWPAYGAFLAALKKARKMETDYTQRRHVNGRLLTAEEREKRHAAYRDAANKQVVAIQNLNREGVPDYIMDEYAVTGQLPSWI